MSYHTVLQYVYVYSTVLYVYSLLTVDCTVYCPLLYCPVHVGCSIPSDLFLYYILVTFHELKKNFLSKLHLMEFFFKNIHHTVLHCTVSYTSRFFFLLSLLYHDTCIYSIFRASSMPLARQ